jgi:hypothetical protein
MLSQTPQNEFLGPEDLAAMVLDAFQLSPDRTEGDLLAAIRSRRNDFEKRAG